MEIFAYLMLGFGIGYCVTMGVTKGPSNHVDRMKHDLEVKKEWIKMLADQKNLKSKWPKGWN
jgi:hypothetical protein